MRIWFPPAIAIAVLACVDDGTVGDKTLRSDSAGIELVASSSGDRSLLWEFEPILELGGADDGAESFFSVPRAGVAFGPAGQIVVLDAGNKHVRVFSESGDFVRTIGREGEGPGEFRLPASLSIDSAGTITVHDFGHRALLHFDSSGTYRDQIAVPASVFGPMRADGDAYVFATRRRERSIG